MSKTFNLVAVIVWAVMFVAFVLGSYQPSRWFTGFMLLYIAIRFALDTWREE